jgi:hypothetical protein
MKVMGVVMATKWPRKENEQFKYLSELSNQLIERADSIQQMAEYVADLAYSIPRDSAGEYYPVDEWNEEMMGIHDEIKEDQLGLANIRADVYNNTIRNKEIADKFFNLMKQLEVS